jgi:hypothetical protein
MKKLITLSSVALALLTASCSNDTVLEEKTEALIPIGFNAAVTKTTRATDLTKDNLEKFYVYGYTRSSSSNNLDYTNDTSTSTYNWSTVFNNEEVTKDDTWTYRNVQYWQDKYDYHFYAVSAAKDEDNYISPKFKVQYDKTNTNDNQTKVNYAPTSAKITFTNIGQIDDVNYTENTGDYDLIYAYSKVENSDIISDDVQLYFKHLLSRVKFKFVGDADNPSTVRVDASAKITNTYKSATFQISGGNVDSFEGDDDSGTLSFYSEELFSNGRSVETNERFIIPAGEDQLIAEVLFNLQANVNESNEQRYDYRKTIPLPQVTMKSGYSYVYVIGVNISEDMKSITFTVNDVESYQTYEEVTSTTE